MSNDNEIEKQIEIPENCPKCDGTWVEKTERCTINRKTPEIKVYCKDCDTRLYPELRFWEIADKKMEPYHNLKDSFKQVINKIQPDEIEKLIEIANRVLKVELENLGLDDKDFETFNASDSVFATPPMKIKGGATIQFARASIDDIARHRQYPDEGLIEAYKGHIQCTQIGGVSMRDIQITDFYEYEIDKRGFWTQEQWQKEYNEVMDECNKFNDEQEAQWEKEQESETNE